MGHTRGQPGNGGHLFREEQLPLHPFAITDILGHMGNKLNFSFTVMDRRGRDQKGPTQFFMSNLM